MENKKTETEPKQIPPSTYKQSLWGVIVIVVILFILAASAFWWAPRFLPTLTKQKTQEQHQMLIEAKEQSQLLLEPLKNETMSLKNQVTTLQGQLLIAKQKLDSLSIETIHASLLLAFMDLKTSIRLGEPYMKELNRLEKLTSQDLSPLESYAESGVPTLLSLVNQLKICIEEMPKPSQKQPAQTLWEKVKARINALVRIKKITPENDNTTDTWGLKPLYLLAKEGDIASVLTQLDQKSLPAQTCLQTWKTQAEAYVNVQNKLDELMLTLFGNQQR